MSLRCYIRHINSEKILTLYWRKHMLIKKIPILFVMLLSSLAAFAQVPAPEAANAVDKKSTEATDFKFSRQLEVPYISTYYVQPVLTLGETAKISYYVTDWYQSEIRFNDKSHRFGITLEIVSPDGKTRTMTQQNCPAGDHEFSFPASEKGIYKIRLQAIDSKGRRSHLLIHEFWVRTKAEQEIKADETMIVQENDLKKYGISNKDVPVEMVFFEVSEEKMSEKKRNELLTKQSGEVAAKNMDKVPANGYMIVAAAQKAPADLLKKDRSCGAYDLPTPEWIPYSWTCRTGKVIYGKNYNKEKVEADSVKNGEGLNKLLADARAAGKRKVVLQPGTYRISHTTKIMIPSGLTLDMNGAVIKLNQFAGHGAMMINMIHCIDSHLINGIVEGDYFEHYYDQSSNNSEWVCGINISGGSRYCSVRNMVVRHITGYGVSNGMQRTTNYGWGPNIKNFQPATQDPETGKARKIEGLWTSADYLPVAKYRDSCGYLTASRVLGYQGRENKSWNIWFHFYDKDKKFIKTVTGWQYRRTPVPGNAEFVRVSVVSDEKPRDNILALNMFKIPWNCTYENIYIQNARCVGMAPSGMFNMKIANCTFVRSGESSATCAFDAEDGWDMMQDVWIYRNRFLMNPRNELLTCAGHNFIIEENEGDLHLWSRTASYVIRNNKFRDVYYGFSGRGRTGLPRIENNNTYTKKVRFGDSNPKSVVPRMKKFLLGTKGAALDEDWAIFMRGKFEKSALIGGPYGFVYGSSINEGQAGHGSRYNLLYCQLTNTNLTHMGNCNLLNSRLINGRGTVYMAKTIIEGCYFKDFTIHPLDGAEITLKDCTLENSSIESGYWVKPAKLKLINCVIKNTDKPAIRIATYTVGEVSFENCTIDTGSAPAVFFFDTRPRDTDNLPGTIRFRNCDLTNSNGFFVGMGDREPVEKNVKPITVEALGSVVTKDGKPMLNKECIFKKSAPAWKVKLSEARTLEMIHRGWDPATGKKIDALLKELK